MNVSDLARRLGAPIKALYEVLPLYGYDIGRHAVKVDDKIADRIQQEWRRIYADWKEKQRRTVEQGRLAEKEARRAAGRAVILPPVLTVREFATALQLPLTTVISELMKNGILVAMNERLDYDTASVIADDLGFVVTKQEGVVDNSGNEQTSQVEALKASLDSEEEKNLRPRPPVIVVMGHVDHGKTKLLDAIRKTNIIDTESGGITQHIGAYQTVRNGRAITFIDTPGHEAFTVMRSRGARVADIAILVVAADEGVMPQTVEAIKIIQAAKLPIVVALNKMDKEGANPDKVKTELANLGVQVEEWGGKVPIVPISAKNGEGIDKILETILLVADMEADRIRANPERPAAGTIIDARIDKGEGPVATLLVQSGTLRPQDPLVVNGQIYGTVRAMKNYLGKGVKSAPPSTPVKILGFKIAPEVGDVLDVAKFSTSEKVRKTRISGAGAAATMMSAQPVTEETDEEKKKIWLNVYVKADVLGSLEAILQSLEKYQSAVVGVRVAGKGLGNFTDAEVLRAASQGTILLGFHVQPMAGVAELILEKNVEFHLFKVIYDLLNFVEVKLNELVPPELIITELGTLKVLVIFRSEHREQVVGARVDQGKILENCFVRVWRNRQYIADGKATSVQLGKMTVKEASAGHECGIRYEGKEPLQVNDVLEAYSKEETKKKITFNKK